MQQISIAALVICAAATNAQSQSPDPGWMDELRSQLIIEQACQASYFPNLHEFDGPLGLQQRARVQCEDGRMFDAERFSPDESFKIQACGTQTCANNAIESKNASI